MSIVLHILAQACCLPDGADEVPDMADADNSFKEMAMNIDIEQDGYIYIYVANETLDNAKVWFDDMTIAHLHFFKCPF